MGAAGALSERTWLGDGSVDSSDPAPDIRTLLYFPWALNPSCSRACFILLFLKSRINYKDSLVQLVCKTSLQQRDFARSYKLYVQCQDTRETNDFIKQQNTKVIHNIKVFPRFVVGDIHMLLIKKQQRFYDRTIRVSVLSSERGI